MKKKNKKLEEKPDVNIKHVCLPGLQYTMSLYRIMAIDFGEKRIGIALTDPLRIFAKPFVVVPNTESTFDDINKIIRDQMVGEIILGLPQNLQGEDTQKTLEVRAFKEELASHTDLPITFWDESYTTADARKLLIKQGYSIQDARKVIDKVAASFILKHYLESLK